LGIIVVGFLFLALSISGLLEYTTYVKKEGQPMLKKIIDENSKRKQRLTLEPNSKDITQEIYGLCLPDYDKDGREVSVIRGAYAIFIKNRLYKVTRPEIEFSSTGDESDNRQRNIVITSDFGEIDTTTKKVSLYENVIIRLEEDFKIYTDDLKYLSNEEIITTDGLVTVKGKGMMITGSGFEISLSDSKALIKNDPEIEINSDRGSFFFSPERKANNSNHKSQTAITHKNIAEKIFIRSSGELIFENKNKRAIFHNNVRISRGEATVFADKLTVNFGLKMKKIKKAIASGNVLASNGEKTAKGEYLSWDAKKQIAILEDDPVAEFFDDVTSITAAKIKFFKNQSRLDVPVSGQLTTKISIKNDQQEKNKDTRLFIAPSNKNPAYKNITITWKGKMSFQQDKNQTIFEGDVIVNKKGTKLYCGKLIVKRDDKNGMMQELEATDNVHLIEKRGNSYREAKGEKLIWTSTRTYIDLLWSLLRSSTRNYIDLYGNPLASVKDGERHISAPKISFSEDGKKILAKGKGNLLVKSYTKKEEDSQLIDISWNEKMVYNGKNKTAKFYEKVKVTKGDEKLDCDRLDVLFHNKDKIKKITASGNVYIACPRLENTEGVGNLLIWDLSEDLAVLTGNPLAELRRSGARTFSEKIYFDINAKRIYWEGKPYW
jgi:LPS export ABC transporter protein LptC/lipopolysaccharide transport protein LptA